MSPEIESTLKGIQGGTVSRRHYEDDICPRINELDKLLKNSFKDKHKYVSIYLDGATLDDSFKYCKTSKYS